MLYRLVLSAFCLTVLIGAQTTLMEKVMPIQEVVQQTIYSYRRLE